jgi:oxygen-independent coproporphyrinogen-3 oxidase
MALEGMDGLGLYVHIPFCRELCSFCPYCKVPYDVDLATSYKSALLKEIDLVGKGINGVRRATSLYFGGGTPALMAEDLPEIITRLKRYFEITGGVGVEIHPQDIDEVTLHRLRAAGVSMVSVGVQSFDKSCLASLGRTWEPLEDKLKLVSDQGFDVIDVDLIFALPGQTRDTLTSDINLAFQNGATQVSTYPFIDFTFARNAFQPISARAKRKMLRILHDQCKGNNLERTSVWTFAKKGTGKYSSVTRDYFLGFGVSATSLLKDTFKINTFSIEEYRKRVYEESLPTALTLRFTKRQRAVYFLFWSAYSLRIDPNRFESIIGIPMQEMFGFEFLLAEKLGFLRKDAAGYELTERAATLYHDIEQVYTRAYIDAMWSTLRLRAFPEKLTLS